MFSRLVYANKKRIYVMLWEKCPGAPYQKKYGSYAG